MLIFYGLSSTPCVYSCITTADQTYFEASVHKVYGLFGLDQPK